MAKTSGRKSHVILIAFIYILFFFSFAEASYGCCSHHGGVCDCVCCDGTSLSAKCAPDYLDCGYVEKDKQTPQEQPFVNQTEQPENTTNYLCDRVIDGDTIVIEDNRKIRLIGVDTPETVHPNKPVEYFGKEASLFTKRMAEGKKVKIEYDWQKKDKYGRTLAYLYLEDGTFLNLEIIRQGYGFAYTKFPFKHLEIFRQAEKEARENRRGLWK
ncbi:MAG: thermonuclease family protein [Thermodesulfobacteriota bacterium]